MPEIGEIRRAREVGLKSNDRVMWHACVSCGKTEWRRLYHGKLRYFKCRFCAMGRGATHYRWNGGRQKSRDGYIRVKILSSDFFYPMANKKGYILEHRLMMAKHLGRNLHPWEIVHHKNHIADGNKIENLALVTLSKHSQVHLPDMRAQLYIGQLEKRIILLEAKLQGGVCIK